jgi:hypothetical protein
MSEAARNVIDHPVERPAQPEYSRQEFWKPSLLKDRTHADTCGTCGTEFPIGARFCYVCGSERDVPGEEPSHLSARWKWLRLLDISELMSAMSLPASSLVAFFVGMVCLIAAAAVGLIFNATTLLDWQAVQLWRMEWLLASIAAFAAGVLLKR